MQYDFSKVFKNKEALLHEFIDTYTTCVEMDRSLKIGIVINYYSNIFSAFTKAFDSDEIVKLFEDLTKYRMSVDVPYIIMFNELYGLKNLIISNTVGHDVNIEIVNILKLFKKINNEIAHLYLNSYVDKLVSVNNIRRNSLADLVEKHLIGHYEAHLIWLSDLALRIKDKEKRSFPQLDETMCDFGLWLHHDAKKLIQNNSKYKSILDIHSRLHLFASKIFDMIETDEHHILITYLEKCELISLSIGTELALLDQISMNKRVTKDPLTGSLNRVALRDVFENQYELSLATSNPFILAMCDLDFFKNVNDTYGHVAGDNMLKEFVRTVQKNIRASDVIIRYGGEEFIIILPSIGKNKGLEVLEKVRAAISKICLDFNGKKIKTTVSIGMTEIKPEKPYKKAFLDEYVMIADRRLYMAKDSGRNKIEYS